VGLLVDSMETINIANSQSQDISHSSHLKVMEASISIGDEPAWIFSSGRTTPYVKSPFGRTNWPSESRLDRVQVTPVLSEFLCNVQKRFKAGVGPQKYLKTYLSN